MFKALLRYCLVIWSLIILCTPAHGVTIRDWFNSLNPTYVRTTYFGLLSSRENGAHNSFTSNKGLVYSIALGKDLKEFLSTEVLLRVARPKSEGLISNIKMNSLFLNLYFKKNVSQNFIPYFMSGMGAGYNTARPINKMIESNSKTSMLYDIGAGIFIKITNKLLLDFNCKHVNLGSLGVSNNGSAHNITSREFLLNLVYKF